MYQAGYLLLLMLLVTFCKQNQEKSIVTEFNAPNDYLSNKDNKENSKTKDSTLNLLSSSYDLTTSVNSFLLVSDDVYQDISKNSKQTTTNLNDLKFLSDKERKNMVQVISELELSNPTNPNQDLDSIYNNFIADQFRLLETFSIALGRDDLFGFDQYNFEQSRNTFAQEIKEADPRFIIAFFHDFIVNYLEKYPDQSSDKLLESLLDFSYIQTIWAFPKNSFSQDDTIIAKSKHISNFIEQKVLYENLKAALLSNSYDHLHQFLVQGELSLYAKWLLEKKKFNQDKNEYINIDSDHKLYFYQGLTLLVEQSNKPSYKIVLSESYTKNLSLTKLKAPINSKKPIKNIIRSNNHINALKKELKINKETLDLRTSELETFYTKRDLILNRENSSNLAANQFYAKKSNDLKDLENSILWNFDLKNIDELENFHASYILADRIRAQELKKEIKQLENLSKLKQKTFFSADEIQSSSKYKIQRASLSPADAGVSKTLESSSTDSKINASAASQGPAQVEIRSETPIKDLLLKVRNIYKLRKNLILKGLYNN